MIDRLPEHLLERTRVSSQQVSGNAQVDQFVLYWMSTAVRADENPALDVARSIADRYDLPLLVYHALSERYRYASDRHHTFILQGARDVQKQLAGQGISYAFHLETPADRKPHLVTLADLASVVVTEDMPVDPSRRFLKALKRTTKTPIISVDTACVAPMQLVNKPYTRAFKFRSATEKIYAERLTRDWPEMDVKRKPFALEQLPFKPVDLQTAEISALVARCEIDHCVGPVLDTVGGSAAGYQRWNTFKEKGLTRYAKQRNNALLKGVSRMSAYLHYGMVSPFRLAREAARFDTAGSEKYLDELLTWRELAYVFCFYRSDHERWSAVPQWAQDSLERHTQDTRPNIYSWEQLARGETSNQFWNAAQKSLLMQGELHNNVRMTWGKAILNWKRTPQEALATIIDLNHRYALDGRDPASYGGILWCLGQFDRPFEPEQNIVGTVRPRPIAHHADRLDPQEYLAQVTEPRFDPVEHVAVIGAGISGLIAARTLQDHGLQVTVFDKSRGIGGRMSTRRIDGGAAFDHGAQYFTARDKRFKRYVDSWQEQGLVAQWPDKSLGDDQKIVVLQDGAIKSESNTDKRFVAVPAMNTICKHLAEGLQIQKQTRVATIKSVKDSEKCGGNTVEIFDDDSSALGKFGRVIVSAPAEQTAELLADFPTLAKPISKIQMNPCWATMVAFEKPITDQWVGAFLHGSFLSWAARNNTKPGRVDDAEHIVIHATPKWTADHWEHDADQVAKMMLSEFWKVTELPLQRHQYLRSHRWKYAIPVDPSEDRCFSDDSAVVVACGDWSSGSRVEGAFLSGMAAAGRVLGTLSTGEKGAPQQSFLFH